MKIFCLVFAGLRDRLGRAEWELTLPEGSTARDACDELERVSQMKIPADFPIYFAINESQADSEAALADGDRVAVLTPVSGG